MNQITHNSLPIADGPLLVTDKPPEPLNHEALFIGYNDFLGAAVDGNVQRHLATTAFRSAISTVIENGPLWVPEPYEQSEYHDLLPLDADYYYVKVGAYVDSALQIRDHAMARTKNGGVMLVLDGVHKVASERLKYDTDAVPLEQLPGAFMTPINPQRRLASGDVLNYADFSCVRDAFGTSTSKIARVFGEVIDQLGNDGARDYYALLASHENSITRRMIRSQLYIKTQSLVDLLAVQEQVPSKRRAFNARSMSLLRSVLFDLGDEV